MDIAGQRARSYANATTANATTANATTANATTANATATTTKQESWGMWGQANNRNRSSAF